jgi:ADA HAT complex component 1
MTEQQAYSALRSRIQDSLKLYHQGKLPGVTGIPSLPAEKAGVSKSQAKKAGTRNLVPEIPHLSHLLQSRKFAGNLGDLVTDAKTKINLDDITPGEESEVAESLAGVPSSKATKSVRPSVVMRVPTKAAQPQTPAGSTGRPSSKKGRAPPISCVTPPNSGMSMGSKQGSKTMLRDSDIEMEDVDLSPNTLVSNNAPSLVSDDGEYDDSDDGSSVSDTSDGLGAESVSDVAEITLDDEQDPRSLRRGSNGVSGAVRLRKEDPKHVTFMSPVKNSTKERRPRRP